MCEKFKLCTKCGISKPISAFSVHKYNSSGFKSECKECTKIYREKHKIRNSAYAKKYYKANRDNLIAASNNYIKSNKEKVKKVRKAYYKANKNKFKVYYQANKEKRLEYSKKYEETNREKINKRRRDARNANLEKTRAKSKTWREKNKDKIVAYREANKEKINAKSRARYAVNKKEIIARDKERRNSEPKYKLNQNMSHAIRDALAGNKNGRHWETLVDFTLTDLKKHLEKQFKKGMAWENYGEWHIDHKIPKSVFNYTKPEHEDFKKCWALKNLQPMWAVDNVKKGVFLFKHFQPSLKI